MVVWKGQKVPKEVVFLDDKNPRVQIFVINNEKGVQESNGLVDWAMDRIYFETDLGYLNKNRFYLRPGIKSRSKEAGNAILRIYLTWLDNCC